MRILIHPTEADREHEMLVRLQGEDGQLVAEMGIKFGVNDPGSLAPGEQASLPIPLALPEAATLPAPGRYSFELLIDGIHQATVPFIATEVQAPELPPPGGEEE